MFFVKTPPGILLTIVLGVVGSSRPCTLAGRLALGDVYVLVGGPSQPDIDLHVMGLGLNLSLGRLREPSQAQWIMALPALSCLDGRAPGTG